MELHALQAGYMLHEYRIEKKLGEGGFGITYLAFDTHLDKRVAIKEYLPSDFAMRQGGATISPKSRTLEEAFHWGLNAFIDEAKVIAKFDAPNIVKVFRFFKANGTAYIVMEYCEGGSLTQRIKSNTLSEHDTRELIEELMNGLLVVHNEQVYHRDIKPDNIMFRKDGTPVLIDFGAARQSVGAKTRTVTAMVTPGYAPPEQYSEKSKLGPWTDIYALAAVAYVCLTGRKPSDSVQRMLEDDYQPLAGGADASGFLGGIDNALILPASQRPQDLVAWFDIWGDTPPEPISSKPLVTEPKDESSKRSYRSLFITLFCITLFYGGYYGYRFHEDNYETNAEILAQTDRFIVAAAKVEENPEPVTLVVSIEFSNKNGANTVLNALKRNPEIAGLNLMAVEVGNVQNFAIALTAASKEQAIQQWKLFKKHSAGSARSDGPVEVY